MQSDRETESDNEVAEEKKTDDEENKRKEREGLASKKRQSTFKKNGCKSLNTHRG